MSAVESSEVDSAALRRALDVTLQHPIIRTLQSRLAHLAPVEALRQPDSRLAAVAALVRLAVDGEYPELLFIKRAVVARDPWSGHVAFPGGRHEAGDGSLVETAIRETREEMSMNLTEFGTLIGQLDDLAPRSPLLPPIIVRPFVFVVPPALMFTPNIEVADAFWVPISVLRSAEARAEHSMLVDGSPAHFPAYGVGGNVIWGLTERIVSQLLPLF